MGRFCSVLSLARVPIKYNFIRQLVLGSFMFKLNVSQVLNKLFLSFS